MSEVLLESSHFARRMGLSSSSDMSATGGWVRLRELAAWGFDHYEFRPVLPAAPNATSPQDWPVRRAIMQPADVVLAMNNKYLKAAFSTLADRADLAVEMDGLDWSLGVVDLRLLIAFQRRLFFPLEVEPVCIPAATDWPALIRLCFGQATPASCTMLRDPASQSITLQSSNPNLQVRFTTDISTPVVIHSGSPFFEVACYRGRWFLRDGYHRAYALLRAGITSVPAVIVQAKTLQELGADQPWFFSEHVLFSDHPPMVTDFLGDDIVLQYERPALIKTIRITAQESLTPATGDLL
jgi:hypothetical protein